MKFTIGVGGYEEAINDILKKDNVKRLVKLRNVYSRYQDLRQVKLMINSINMRLKLRKLRLLRSWNISDRQKVSVIRCSQDIRFY